MVWRTFFKCEQVEVMSSKAANDSRLPLVETWQSARVYLSEITENKRWILVTVNEDERKPIIWHTIKDNWVITCDEEKLTLEMRGTIVVGTSPVLQIDKLRFTTPQDFWTFVANYTFSRVQADPAAGWGEA